MDEDTEGTDQTGTSGAGGMSPEGAAEFSADQDWTAVSREEFIPSGVMRWTFVQQAGTFSTGKGDFPERYAPTAWDNMIGQVVPMTYEGAPLAHGRLLTAKVNEDGSAVELTFEQVVSHG